jgi:hypothetical protein
MKSRSPLDLQDSSAFGIAGDQGYPNYWLSSGEGTPVADARIGAMANASSSVTSTTAGTAGTLVVVTSGGLTFDLLFDAAAPASFRTGIQQAASILAATISDKITVNLNIHYSGTGGGAFAGPDNGFYESYSSIRSDLINKATTGDTTFNALPTGSSIQGQSNVAVWNAELKLWGFLGANDTTTDDGSATFATDINSSLLVGVALHELTHALGRVPFGAAPDIFDLFRFTSPGVRLFQSGNAAPAAYFSVDGGNTKLADFGQNSDPSDFLNSGVQGTNDPFNEFYSGSTSQILSTVDKELLDALGFHTSAPATTTVIEALGSTSLVQVGNNFFLDSISSGTGPTLKMNGAAVVAGQMGGWAPIGVEQTATGYEVAWKNVGTSQYSVWNTDSNGNYTSNAIGIALGTDPALESIETSFHQDLNGDGVINTPATVIEATGNVMLTLSPITQAAMIDAGATLELAGADSGSITFSGSTGTLVLDHSSLFTGTILNLTGNGNPASSDQIDLKDISFGSGTTASYAGNTSGGILTISDAQNHTANLSLAGNYTKSTWTLSGDGHGGTSVIDPPLPSGNVPSEDPATDPVDAALNQRLALWSQHMASAFPCSAFGNGGASMVSPSGWADGQLSQLAPPVTNQQHA